MPFKAWGAKSAEGDTYGVYEGEVVGRWNPIRMGVYADWIIRNMGATPAEIQAHIDRVIGAEVAKSKPFVFIPDKNIRPEEGGGYFLDRRTGQMHDAATWAQKSAIYGKLESEEIS